MTRKKKKAKASKRIQSFDFEPGRILARQYEVLEKLGDGWEGEVYKIKDRQTGIPRAAKLFFPHRNKKQKTSTMYAQKLYRLQDSPVVIKYNHQETILFQNQPVMMLISEFVEGPILSAYLAKCPGKRLSPFQAVHLLYSLTLGIENIHRLGEYHGDLHTDNIIVRRHGLSYDLKLLDFFHWGRVSKANREEDICKLIDVFYEALGGQKHYAKHPKEIKAICCGRKRSLLLKKFRSASDLRTYLEALAW